MGKLLSRRKRLPPDAQLLPLTSGALLVSRKWAVFCRVPAEDLPTVEGMLKGSASCADLPPSLLDDLDTHGFFGKPRPAESPRRLVQVQLTRDCEFGCPYCCADAGCAPRDEITFEEAVRIAEQTRRVLGRGAQFGITGGEPLSVPWAIDLAERAVDLGLKLTLFTTGVPLADAALAERMAALTARGADLRVGLPGPNAELCDAVSKGTRFDKCMQGIDRIAHFGGRLSVDLMLFPQHVETMTQYLPALRKRLPEGMTVTLNPLLHAGRERGELSFASRTELEDALDRVAIRAGVAIPAPRRAPVVHRRDGCSCSLGEQVHVRSDRAVFPCTRMEEQVGDLADEDFADTLKRVRRTRNKATELPLCRTCALATICGGGCRSENARLGGDPEVPVCGPWRVRVLSELLAEDRVSAVEWPVAHLLAEAASRGIDVPAELPASRPRSLNPIA